MDKSPVLQCPDATLMTVEPLNGDLRYQQAIGKSGSGDAHLGLFTQKYLIGAIDATESDPAFFVYPVAFDTCANNGTGINRTHHRARFGVALHNDRIEGGYQVVMREQGLFIK